MANFKRGCLNILLSVIIILVSGIYNISAVNETFSSDELDNPKVLPTRNKRQVSSITEEENILFGGRRGTKKAALSQLDYPLSPATRSRHRVMPEEERENTSDIQEILQSKPEYDDSEPSYMLITITASECRGWTFDYDYPYTYLGSAKLEAYPYIKSGRVFTGLNLTLMDFSWSFLRIRYQQNGNSATNFCREFHVFPEFNITELFYDCHWICEEYEGTSFIVEYEAHNPPFVDTRMFMFKIPHSQNTGNYREKKIIIIGIVGAFAFSSFVFFILYIRRHPLEASRMTKWPVVLIIYTASHTSHVEAVMALAKFLKKHGGVKVLLDQLEIPGTETEDPSSWYNSAFARAQFVMVVSSPPKCCSQEGTLRDMDVNALQILKEKSSDNNSLPHFLSVVLPYCKIEDITQEAKNFPRFKLMQELGKMLWFIHNDGKFLTFMDVLHMMLILRITGKRFNYANKASVLLTAIRKADEDLRICKFKEGNFKGEITFRPIIPDAENNVEQ